MTVKGQIHPLVLERLTRHQARLVLSLGRQAPPLALDLPKGPLAVRLILVTGVQDAPKRPIRLQYQGGNLWLEPDDAHLQQWLRPWIGELDPDQLPPALRAAAMLAALSPLLAALETLLGVQLVASFEQTESMASAATILALCGVDAQSAPLAHLGLDEATSSRLVARLEQGLASADNLITERWPELPIALTPWLGSIHLRPAEWRALEIGDLLLLPRQVDSNAIPLHLRQRGRTLALAHLSSQRLIIDSLVSSSMVASADTTDKSAPAALDPDGLEISVDLELASLQVPLRELRAIQPGYCFELTDLDRPRIRLVVGGKLIGYGELVLIEDHLGVRVTELFGAPPPT